MLDALGDCLERSGECVLRLADAAQIALSGKLRARHPPLVVVVCVNPSLFAPSFQSWIPNHEYVTASNGG